MSVIAEGVETEALHAELVGLGCELAQGFFYDRPKPARTSWPSTATRHASEPGSATRS